MEKWWRERFIDRRAWILDHLEDLSLSSEEAMTILLIDFFNEYDMPVHHGVLANKLKLDMDQVDDLLARLGAKGYVSIETNHGEVQFCIDGIFADEKETSSFDLSLFEVFEDDFARPLSQMEVELLSQWTMEYDQTLIVYALREAMTKNKRSFDYIDRILLDWKRRGFSAEDYERGER